MPIWRFRALTSRLSATSAGADYYANFGDIYRITDSTPTPDAGNVTIPPSQAKDYHDYGETLILTDEVKGKKEYYINVSFNSDFMGAARISELAFAEKVPVDFSDTERYSTVNLTNMSYTGVTDTSFIGHSCRRGRSGSTIPAARQILRPTMNIPSWSMSSGG